MIQEQFKHGLFALEYIPTNLQKADILTKVLTPKKHNNMTNLLGIQYTQLLTLLMFVCMSGITQSIFLHEDAIIWKETNTILIDGQHDMDIKFIFIDPCPYLFNNITGIPYVDASLTTTCSKRYSKDILGSLKSIATNNKNRIARDDGVTAIIA